MKFKNWSLIREDKIETLWTFDENYSNGDTIAVIVSPWSNSTESSNDYLVDAVAYDPERENTVPGDDGEYRKEIGTGVASSWTEAKEMARNWMKKHEDDALDQIEYNPQLYGIVQYRFPQADGRSEAKEAAEIEFEEDIQSSGVLSQDVEILSTNFSRAVSPWFAEFEVEVQNHHGRELDEIFSNSTNIT